MGALQGLATISTEVIALAEKAKQGKLQPHEFQVRSTLDVSTNDAVVKEDKNH